MYKVIFVFIFLVSNASFAKSKCQKEWNALKSVQSELRHKSTSYLREKEHKKHKDYQDCRKEKKNTVSKYKNKSKQPSKPISSYKSKKSYKVKQPNYSGNIKGMFSGEKQNAWLNYYRQPKKCRKTKTTQQFSKCLQHRDVEAMKFEKLWMEKTAPPSIKLEVN